MISTIILSQRPTLLSTTLRSQAAHLLVWKQRSTKDLESVLETYDALVPGDKREVLALYEYATSRPYATRTLIKHVASTMMCRESNFIIIILFNLITFIIHYNCVFTSYNKY